MKRIFILLFSGTILLAMKNRCSSPKIADTHSDSASSVYPIQLKTLDGKGLIDFSAYKGKKILIVNTASECGFTYQYEGLQKLYASHQGKLVIIGCPCNQFGGQEPGDSAEIRGFCSKNYGVSFPISEKLDVRGDKQHPLYKWLTRKSENGVLDADVKWNFNKFLLDSTGRLMAYFPSRIKPDDPELLKLIEQ